MTKKLSWFAQYFHQYKYFITKNWHLVELDKIISKIQIKIQKKTLSFVYTLNYSSHLLKKTSVRVSFCQHQFYFVCKEQNNYEAVLNSLIKTFLLSCFFLGA